MRASATATKTRDFSEEEFLEQDFLRVDFSADNFSAENSSTKDVSADNFSAERFSARKFSVEDCSTNDFYVDDLSASKLLSEFSPPNVFVKGTVLLQCLGRTVAFYSTLGQNGIVLPKHGTRTVPFYPNVWVERWRSTRHLGITA